MAYKESSGKSGEVWLAGGPGSLRDVFPLANAALVDAERLVVTHNGRNEHYAFTMETESKDGVAFPVAQWTYSTAVAE